MLLRNSLRNILLIIMAAFILSACAAKTTKKIEAKTTQLQETPTLVTKLLNI